eukprot:TRINITY_DN5320_c0_g1_i1.p1 TRINITY_DN5320_c0_g1~~TRINITY_DN5320_c0_g1_i1.p1  ORF type:complete len:336 (-),score=57.12 TRINITY_DN5320_c0_g1_i1:25-1032(-)
MSEWNKLMSTECPLLRVVCFKGYVIIGGGGGQGKTGVPDYLGLFKIRSDGSMKKLNIADTDNTVTDITYSDDGNIITVERNKIRYYKIENDELVFHEEIEQDNMLSAAQISSDGKYLALGYKFVDDDGNDISRTLIKNLENDSDIGEYPLDSRILRLVWCPNSILAIVTKPEITIVDIENNTTTSISHPELSTNGCRILGDYMYTIQFLPRVRSTLAKWDLKTGEIIKEVSMNEKYHATSMDISPCGEYIVLGMAKGDIRVYNTANLSFYNKLNPHEFVVSDITFNGENGQNVLSTSLDYTLVSTSIRRKRRKYVIMIAIIILLLSYFMGMFEDL